MTAPWQRDEDREFEAENEAVDRWVRYDEHDSVDEYDHWLTMKAEREAIEAETRQTARREDDWREERDHYEDLEHTDLFDMVRPEPGYSPGAPL